MTSEQTIIEIKKRKFFFITVLVLLFIASYMVQSKFINQFTSYTNLIVNEVDITQFKLPSEQNIQVFNSSASIVNRVVLFAYSSEMIDHLIKKFHLYEYYQVNPKEKFAYSKIVERLSNNIIIRKTDFNMIKLSVSDMDRYEAASMANEMAWKLNEINSNFIKQQVRKKMVLYQSLYYDLKNETEKQKDTLRSVVEGMKEILFSLERNKMNVEELKNAITNLSNGLNDKTAEMIKMKQLYLVVLQSLNKENLETITIVNHALPDYHQNTVQKIFYSFMVTLIAACLMIVLLYMFIKHNKYIKLIISK
jgi:hypothetical protein